ncbi:MAG: pantoate--beta-alanine ligase [Ferruginibacter sp.]
MILFRKAADISNYLQDQRKNNRLVGFIPTMGALHHGHINLIEQSVKQQFLTVCSIFINPTQFNNAADFSRYPVTIEKDIEQLEAADCDILFLPAVEEIYPKGTKAPTHYELGFLETILEGKYRPGHFQGVCQVVNRLLDIVMPDTLYLGQKDYQQCMVISKMISSLGWENKIHIAISPTIRESDGLAMSSRNMRLTTEERKRAVLISATLQSIKSTIQPGPLDKLKKNAREELEAAGFKVDYAEIASAKDLHTIDHWDGNTKLVALIAAYLNEVRLIDNMLIN